MQKMNVIKHNYAPQIQTVGLDQESGIECWEDLSARQNHNCPTKAIVTLSVRPTPTALVDDISSKALLTQFLFLSKMLPRRRRNNDIIPATSP